MIQNILQKNWAQVSLFIMVFYRIIVHIHPIFLQVYGVILSTFRSRLKLSNICYNNKISKIEISVYIQVYIQVYIHVCCTSKVIGRKDASHFKQHTYIKTLLLVFKSLFRYLLSQNFMLRIKELNLTCMINDSERITEKLGHCVESLNKRRSDNFVVRI